MFEEIMDQAAGLRRMLATVPQPRRITFLSAIGDPSRKLVVANLAASLARQGGETLLVDTRGACPMQEPALLDVVAGRRALGDTIIVRPGAGFARCSLSHGLMRESVRPHSTDASLCRMLDQLSKRFSTMLVDAEPDERGNLPISTLDQSWMVVHVNDQPDSIKHGYALIKKMVAATGKMQFGVLVSGRDASRAGLIYANLAKTARRYLAVSLYDMGFIPQDEHVHRAARLGRPVVDAFPSARASVAFQRVAGQLSMI